MNNHLELMFGIHQLLMYFHKNGLITTEQFLDVLDNCNVANGIPKAIEYAKSNLKKEESYVSIPVDVDLARRIDELRLRGLAKCQNEEGWADFGKKVQGDDS